MAEVILDTGDPVLLELGLTVNYTLRLYTNNLDPATTNIITDFTECTDDSYAPTVLTGGSWAITTLSNKGRAEHSIQTFNIASDLVTVYGWFIDRGGIAIAAGKLTTSFTGPGTLRIVPVISSDNGA